MRLSASWISATAMAAGLIAAAIPPALAQESSTACLGHLMLFGGTFCPRGYAETDGSLLSVSGNTALFSIYGTMYGGNGQTTFGLPDLRGRAPIGQGTGQNPPLPSYVQGQKYGSPTVDPPGGELAAPFAQLERLAGLSHQS